MKPLRLAAALLAANCSFAYADAPSQHGESHEQEQRQTQGQTANQEDPTVGKDAPKPAVPLPEQQGAINPMNGQYYPPTGSGDVINPATGERYPGVSGGYVNPNTGEFIPKIR